MEKATAHLEIAERRFDLVAKEVSRGNYSADLMVDGVSVLGSEGHEMMRERPLTGSLKTAKAEAETLLWFYLRLHTIEWPTGVKIEWSFKIEWDMKKRGASG
jgi:hypothetical protein